MKPYSSSENSHASDTIQDPLCVLVAEDHGEMNVTQKMFFDILGHHARFAVNVALALRAAAEDSFDVLLTDIGLPDGNGWDLRRRLAEAGRCPLRSIAMSGISLGGHAARSEAAGFALHLVKPFDPELLIAALVPATVVEARLPRSFPCGLGLSNVR